MQQVVRHPSEWSAAAASEPGSVLLQRVPSHGDLGRSMLFSNPARIIAAHHPKHLPEALDAVEEALAEGLYIAGYIAYEAGFALEPSLANLSSTLPNNEPLLWFGCYRSPEISQETIVSQVATTPSVHPQFLLSADEHADRVEAIRSLIAAGETYQANLTTEVLWHTNESPAEMYQRFLRAQPVPYAAMLHPIPGWHILSLSPELFFARHGDRIITRPMKGTAAPGMDAAELRANSAWLQSDEKNRAENLMIVDLLRNDLGRICKMGSVHVSDLFKVEQYPTVLQMTSTIEGTLREGVGYPEIFRALFPSGSIVGAPKIHTMRLLHALENQPRGVYTGAIGYISPHGEAEFNVAIRTISLRGNEARLGVGSGIVYDSRPETEYAECHTKINFLTREPVQDFELIETLLLHRGSYTLLPEHIERMRQSADYFDMPFDITRVHEALEEAAQASPSEAQTRVRVLLRQDGAVTWTASGITGQPETPATLLLSPEKTDPSDRFLRHKTTRRAFYDEAFRHAQTLGLTDALFRNTRNEITEGAIHNIIAVVDSLWLTPPLASGVLPGVYRQHLLQQGQLTERVLTIHDLMQASTIYICNSVRGLRPVERIVEHIVEQSGQDGFETIWHDPTLCSA
ncbi:aminodeoxychorismate synthase component I [Acidicapsa dinghuensis]|uniref:Aminodeoxychorismate synthase component I n=1 Tax=Acidicapsa dinghuensis TaxID=2218256 RepID=A0ABW1EBQ3_9BACT|nr:aminodeoxychorismate synthase component I [Acidicapsa dinghuensis]